jgi:hypothetical protein
VVDGVEAFTEGMKVEEEEEAREEVRVGIVFLYFFF